MIYSREYNTIFVRNQKTGSSSIRKYFEQHVPDSKSILPRHSYVAQGIELLGDRWRRNYSFGFVRNPWARLVSWYTMIAERPQEGEKNELWTYVRTNARNFDEFLRNCPDTVVRTVNGVESRKSLVTNQLDYFTDINGQVAVSFIGKFEQLSEDFVKVIQDTGLPDFPLPHTNKTSEKTYRAFYTPETQQLIADRFAKDIDYFGIHSDSESVTCSFLPL